MLVKLNQEQKKLLLIDNIGSGGFQSLMQRLQDNFNSQTMELILDRELLEKVLRYAYNYDNGGWQQRLENIFDL